MNIIDAVIVSPGKSKFKFVDEYIDRYKRNCYKPVAIRTDFFGKRRDKFNEISLAKKGDEYIIICDERGDDITSLEFADLLSGLLDNSKRKVYFFIGDAEGFGDYKIERYDKKIKLSKMTMIHDFARLFLAEQIFRASSIIKGTAYHK